MTKELSTLELSNSTLLTQLSTIELTRWNHAISNDNVFFPKHLHRDENMVRDDYTSPTLAEDESPCAKEILFQLDTFVSPTHLLVFQIIVH